MKKYILKIFIFILILFFTIPLFSIPGKNDVEKIVKNEIEKEINKNKRNQIISNFFFSIFKMIRSSSTFLFYMFITFIIITIVLVITQIIVNNISTSKYASLLTNEIIQKHKETVFNEKTFEELIRNNDFSRAIIYLHRCTIFYLLKNKITYNKNLTNYTLYKKINDNSIKNAFQKIYKFSVKISIIIIL